MDRKLLIPPPCDATLGLECIDKSEPGVTVWTMPADERFLNPGGIVQGGFLAALADSAMSAAVVTANRGRKVLLASTDIQVRFFSAVEAGRQLTCTGRVTVSRRRVAFAEADIVDERGTQVAKASSTFYITEREG